MRRYSATLLKHIISYTDSVTLVVERVDQFPGIEGCTVTWSRRAYLLMISLEYEEVQSSLSDHSSNSTRPPHFGISSSFYSTHQYRRSHLRADMWHSPGPHFQLLHVR